jgi:hypothetical protein
MGLDQYAEVRKPNEEEPQEIAYWRKHNRLQGWMEQLFFEKGGTGEFNLQEVKLTLEDLDQLEATINDHQLPETGGFFFGSDSYEHYDEDYKETDEKFIADAREAIEAGFEVYYTCWW